MEYKESTNGLFKYDEISDAKDPVGFKNHKETTKIMFLLFWFIIVLVGVLVFLFKIPMRIIADIKNTMREFLTKYDEVLNNNEK